MTMGLISNGYIVLIFELRGHLCFPFKIFLMILPIGKMCIESRWFPASQCAGGGGWHGFCPGGGDGSRPHWLSNCWGRAPDPRWRPPPSWIWGWCAGETKHNVCLVPCCIVCTDLLMQIGLRTTMLSIYSYFLQLFAVTNNNKVFELPLLISCSCFMVQRRRNVSID